MIYLKATLPKGVSLNATYNTSGHWYPSKRAKEWKNLAFPLLRAAGFIPQPKGKYRARGTIILCSRRLDIDATTKGVLDLIQMALSPIDDPNLPYRERRKLLTFNDKANKRILLILNDEIPKDEECIRVKYGFEKVD